MSLSFNLSNAIGSGGKTSSSKIEKSTPPDSSGIRSPLAEASVSIILPCVMDCDPSIVNADDSLAIAISNSMDVMVGAIRKEISF